MDNIIVYELLKDNIILKYCEMECFRVSLFRKFTFSSFNLISEYEGGEGLFSWCVISLFYFAWTVKAKNYLPWNVIECLAWNVKHVFYFSWSVNRFDCLPWNPAIKIPVKIFGLATLGQHIQTHKDKSTDTGAIVGGNFLYPEISYVTFSAIIFIYGYRLNIRLVNFGCNYRITRVKIAITYLHFNVSLAVLKELGLAATKVWNGKTLRCYFYP